jgi:hypothetical protein
MNGNGHNPNRESAAKKLRRIIQKPGEFILCPGVYDGLSSRVALSVGFDALYMACSFFLFPRFNSQLTMTRLERELVHLVLAMLIWVLPTCMTCVSMQR